MLSLGGFFFGWVAHMRYTKSPLTFEQQADLLLSRGMAGERELMIQRLKSVNYYRLSGYWYPFRGPGDEFIRGTSFDIVWARYAFDRQLRVLVMDAIERIEIATRTWLAYHHSHAYGPFAYATDPATLPKLDPESYERFLDRVREETGRSKEAFVAHFAQKYGDCHDFLPLWVATEVMAFGTILTFFRGTTRKVKREVAAELGLPPTILESWLLTLNAVRNICAHHGRLWNRVLGVKPRIPRQDQYPEWHDPVEIDNSRVFAVLTICQFCLRTMAPQSGWPARLAELLSNADSPPLADMGFKEGWKSSPLWTR